MAAQSSLQIRTLSVDFSLSHWGPGAHAKALQDFQRRIKSGLEQAWCVALKPLDNGDERLLFIKKIAVKCDLDLSANGQGLFAYWAATFKHSLADLLRSKENTNLVIFASEQAYCAQFLCDLLAGRAWQQWYYRRFAGLRSLPLTAALRTLLVDEQQPALAAAYQLPQHQVIQLCAALSENDCKFLVHFIQRKNAATQAPVDLTSSTANRLLTSVLQLLDQHHCEANSQTKLYLAFMTGRSPGQSSTDLPQDCLTALIALKKIQQHTSAEKFAHLLVALQEKTTSPLRLLVNHRELAELAWFIAQPAARITAIVQLLLAQPALSAQAARALDTSATAPARFTRFGNLLFLLYHLNELQLQDWLTHCQPCKGAGGAALFKLLAVCACQGQGKFHAAFKDPLVQDLCGIKTDNRYPLDFAEALDWLMSITPDATHSIQDHFQAFLSQSLDTPGNVFEPEWQALSINQAHVRIYSESKKGHWLRVEAQPNSSLENQSPPVEGVGSELENLPQALADAQFLWPALPAQMPAHCAALICLLAQYALRRFSWRLPGFSRSTPDYLLRSFLAMSLTLKERETHFIAQVSRVPMSIILNMTGITRSNIHLSDFDLRPLHLHEVDS